MTLSKTNIFNINNILLSGLAFLLASSLFIFLEYNVCKYEDLNTHTRIIICLFLFTFLLVNIWWDYKKLWRLIHKYRYLIAILIFAILVFLEVNTSSAGVYNQTIQPNSNVANEFPFWGSLKAIRSDEYLATSPTYLSQALDGTFAENNDLIMATMSPLTLQPKVTTLNISVLASPQLLGFFVLGPVKGFSFSSLFPIFAAFMATYELMRLLTRDNKVLSVCATVVIVFSPAVLWWGCYQYVTYGFICIVLFNKIISCDSHWKNILLSIAIGWSFACYVMCCYPAWIIPFGYLYLFIFVGLLIERRKELRVIKFVYLLSSLVVLFVLVVPAFYVSQSTSAAMSQTVYPGARFDAGGYGWQNLFNWFSSPIFSWNYNGNTCEPASFVGLFPLPFIVSIIVLIKQIKSRNIDFVLFFITAIGILLTLWIVFGSELISKITLLYMCPTGRTVIVVELASCLVLFRLLSTYKPRAKGIRAKRVIAAVLVALVVVGIACLVVRNDDFLSKKHVVILVMFFVVVIFLLVYNSKISRVAAVSLLTALGIFSFATILPFSFGLNTYFEKPLSKEVQAQVADNRDEIWASVGDTSLPNFILANGARTINSVNFYPNLELWHRIDPERQYEDVYNRYAHIEMKIVDSQNSSFELLQPDAIKVNLSVNDVKKLGITRFVSHDSSLESFSNTQCSINKTYEEDGVAIYSVS